MSILSLDKLGLGKLLLNCMYIFLQFIFTFKSTVHESATEIAPSYFFSEIDGGRVTYIFAL